MAGAARVFRGDYRTRYVYHAQMEPLSATAAVSPDGKSAEIWAGTQGPTGLLNQVARLLQTERSEDHACISICWAADSAAAASRRWSSMRCASPRRSASR